MVLSALWSESRQTIAWGEADTEKATTAGFSTRLPCRAPVRTQSCIGRRWKNSITASEDCKNTKASDTIRRAHMLGFWTLIVPNAGPSSARTSDMPSINFLINGHLSEAKDLQRPVEHTNFARFASFGPRVPQPSARSRDDAVIISRAKLARNFFLLIFALVLQASTSEASCSE